MINFLHFCKPVPSPKPSSKKPRGILFLVFFVYAVNARVEPQPLISILFSLTFPAPLITRWAKGTVPSHTYV